MTISYDDCANSLFEVMFLGVGYWVTDINRDDTGVTLYTFEKDRLHVTPQTIMNGLQIWVRSSARDDCTRDYRPVYDAVVNNDYGTLANSCADVADIGVQYGLFGELRFA